MHVVAEVARLVLFDATFLKSVPLFLFDFQKIFYFSPQLTSHNGSHSYVCLSLFVGPQGNQCDLFESLAHFTAPRINNFKLHPPTSFNVLGIREGSNLLTYDVHLSLVVQW